MVDILAMFDNVKMWLIDDIKRHLVDFMQCIQT